MNKAKQTPTKEFYGAIEATYNFFNERLFDGKLPDCIIVISRKKNVMGYFMHDRWTSTTNHEFRSELAINPGYIAKHPMMEFFQTVVHEQCHLWQYLYGKPSRRSYHNKEWADKMESFGLIPSHTGAPGGKRTGQTMADYAAPGGRFARLCEEFAKDFQWLWVDRRQHSPETIREHPQNLGSSQVQQILSTPLEELGGPLPLNSDVDGQAQAARNCKTKFSCSCGQNLWGKPGLDVTCNRCGTVFVPKAGAARDGGACRPGKYPESHLAKCTIVQREKIP